ncbi:MAG: hypothetical protein AB7T31_17770 [Gemmatimonadales bacterium]
MTEATKARVDVSGSVRLGEAVTPITGEAAAVLRTLEAKSTDGSRVYPEHATASLVVTAEPVGKEKAIGITDHLLGASENHPRDGLPLEFRTDHDEQAERLTVSLQGSVSAVSYLLFLVHLHMTQSRH